MKIRLFAFMEVDIPQVIGEEVKDIADAKEIAAAIQVPPVLETSVGALVIVDRFHINTIDRILSK